MEQQVDENEKTNDDDDSESSDDWATADINLPVTNKASSSSLPHNDVAVEITDESYWISEEPRVISKDDPSTVGRSSSDTFARRRNDKQPAHPQQQQQQEQETESEPMMIVDLTKLSLDAIHSRLDRNSVNDPEAASALRKQVQSNSNDYARNPNHLADGTVIPCSTNVWKDALVRLRDERPGHYFVPIFPTTTTTTTSKASKG